MVLKKEFKKNDTFQQLRTIGYLENLKKAQMKDVRQYCRLFKTSVDYLMGVGQLAEYQSALWFLQGLLESWSRRFVKHDNIDVSDPSTMKFGKLYKEAIR